MMKSIAFSAMVIVPAFSREMRWLGHLRRAEAAGENSLCGGDGQVCCSPDEKDQCSTGTVCGKDNYCLPPSCVSPTGLVSDEFKCERLGNIWKQFPDSPLGGSSITFNATGNQLEIYVDDDVKQKMGTANSNRNSAPRIYQQMLPSYNADFEVEVKFDESCLPDSTTNSQDHGIFFQIDNDDSKFLFFASQANTENIRMVARFVNAADETPFYGKTISLPPNRFRVEKTGKLFRLYTAQPGEEYFTFMKEFLFEDGKVTGAGIFASNRNKNAEYRAKVDYFKVFCPPIAAQDECTSQDL